MKKKNLFITAALSVLLGLGVTAGISAASSNESIVKVEAAYRPGTAGKNVYLNCQGTGWDGANAKLIFHRFENSYYGGGNHWYQFSKISVLGDNNSQLYVANPEYNAWSCKFLRVNPAKDSDVWNTLEYANLYDAGNSNVYKIAGSFSGWFDSDQYNIYKLTMKNDSNCGTAYIENNDDKIYASTSGNFGYVYKHITHTVKAIPQVGYKFDHWEIASTGYEIVTGSLTSDEFTIKGFDDDTTITAYYTTAMTVAKGKARLWIGYGSGNFKYTNENAAIVAWIHSTADGGSEHVYKSTTPGDWGTFTNTGDGLDGLRYDWFDIDVSDYTNGWYLTIQRFDPTCTTQWNGTYSIQLTTSNVGMVYYPPNVYNYSGNITVGTIDKVHAAMATIALAGCLTCSNSNYNGHGSVFTNVESSFIKDGSSFRTVGELSSYNVYDYETGDTSYSGERTKVINGYSKYQWLRYTSGKDPVMPGPASMFIFKDFTNNGGSAAVIIIISIVSVAALGGYFFLRKKKQK